MEETLRGPHRHVTFLFRALTSRDVWKWNCCNGNGTCVLRHSTVASSGKKPKSPNGGPTKQLAQLASENTSCLRHRSCGPMFQHVPGTLKSLPCPKLLNRWPIWLSMTGTKAEES
mmetsp:Transcript_16312/g.22791  ORF Transcript_16312/g.22791 Transcript_16312/m.22791 type:complete len:115 (+) Transcript_16312:183-527(+)